MNQTYLEQLQEHAYTRLKTEGAAATDPARRSELLADAREQRLLEMMNDAVFFGTLKAHLTLAVIGAGVWFLVVNVLLS